MRPFRYEEFAANPRVTDWVLTYWSFESRLAEGEAFVHHVWPDGCVSVSVAMHGGRPLGTMVTGPRVEAAQVTIREDVTVHGIRFRPEAGGLVCGRPAASLRGRMVPGVELLGAGAERLGRALAAAPELGAGAGAVLDRWFEENLGGLAAADPLVRRAVDTIVSARGSLSVMGLAGRVGLSPRQLQRRFRRAVGLTAKEYSRVRRMRSALEAFLCGGTEASAIAYRLGYADQSHLITELGRLTGLTPSVLERRLALIEHVNVAP